VSTITLPEAATSGSSWTDPTTARSSSSITAPRVRRRPDRRTYAPRRRADIASSPPRGPGTPCHPDIPGAAWPTSPPTPPRHRSGAGNIEEFGAVLADIGVPTYLWQGSEDL